LKAVVQVDVQAALPVGSELLFELPAVALVHVDVVVALPVVAAESGAALKNIQRYATRVPFSAPYGIVIEPVLPAALNVFATSMVALSALYG
jgi:hypothetical protein